MRLNLILGMAACAIVVTAQACAGIPGIPPAAVAQADRVTITTEQALIIANDAEDAFVLRVEAHVLAGDIHGADATRLRQAITAISATLNAADAAQRLGQDAVVAAKAGDAIRLITGLTHDFPILANSVPH